MGNDPINNIDPSGGITYCPGTSALAIFLDKAIYAIVKVGPLTSKIGLALSIAKTGSIIEKAVWTSAKINGQIRTMQVGGENNTASDGGSIDPEAPDEPPVNKPFNYYIEKTIYKTEYRVFYETRRNNTGIKLAATATLTLAGDDVTGVGVIDDIAIPFIWLGAITYDYFSKPVTIPVVRPVAVPVTISIPLPAPLVYVTYTKFNPTTGQVYVGRASGYGDPLKVVRIRDYGHKDKDKEGFLPAVLDRFLTSTLPYAFRANDPSYGSVRGREQLYIDHLGGIGSPKVRNLINGISLINIYRETYLMLGRALGGFIY
jgi:hypothetical protein